VALTESAQDEEAGDARLSRALCHDLVPLSVALAWGRPSRYSSLREIPPHPKMTSQGMTRPSASRTPSRVVSPRSSSGLPSTRPIPHHRVAPRTAAARRIPGKEGHVIGKHLLHADAEACAVDGGGHDEQLPAGCAVTVADHAGEVGDAEEARRFLKGAMDSLAPEAAMTKRERYVFPAACTRSAPPVPRRAPP